MARSKQKKRKKERISRPIDETLADETKVPISNLPETFLWMKVKSGTKMKKVLEYSLKEFPTRNSVVWSGCGQGIKKVISCAEIFKRKISGLHQITKLRYVKSKHPSDQSSDENFTKDRVVPEIHIFLSKNILDTKEPGYQAPGVCTMFQDPKVTEITEKTKNKGGDSRGMIKTKMSERKAEELESMGLRTGQKRQRRDNPSDTVMKKTKKKDDDGNK